MSATTTSYCIDEAALRAALDDLIREHGTQTALAAHLDISSAYLSDVLHGRRPIGAMAARLGYRPLTVFVRDDGHPGITPAMAARVIEIMRSKRIQLRDAVI